MFLYTLSSDISPAPSKDELFPPEPLFLVFGSSANFRTLTSPLEAFGNNWVFKWWGCEPHNQPLTQRARASLFVWHLLKTCTAYVAVSAASLPPLLWSSLVHASSLIRLNMPSEMWKVETVSEGRVIYGIWIANICYIMSLLTISISHVCTEEI